jgi:integrase
MDSMTPFERAARALIASRAAPGTRVGYTADLGSWLAFCEAEGIDPAEPTPDGPPRFRDRLLKRYAPQTVRRMLAALSKMYRSAHAARATSGNPFDGDALPRPPADAYARTEAIPQDIAQRIISSTQEDETPTGVRDLAVLRLLYDTGMRRASIAGLRRADVFDREGRIIVGYYGKGNKRHEATLPEEAAAAVLAWIKHGASAYVFPQEGNPEKHIDPSTVNRIVKHRTHEAGASGTHPHQFRAAFITEALDELPLHEVQAAVGHADPRMTLRYDRGKRGSGVADRVATARRQHEDVPDQPSGKRRR